MNEEKEKEKVIIADILKNLIEEVPKNHSKITFIPTTKNHAILRFLSYRCNTSISKLIRTAITEFIEKIPLEYDKDDIVRFDISNIVKSTIENSRK